MSVKDVCIYAAKYSKLCKIAEGDFEDEADKVYHLELDDDTLRVLETYHRGQGDALYAVVMRMYMGSVDASESEANALELAADEILGGNENHEHAHKTLDALQAAGYSVGDEEELTDPNFQLPDDEEQTEVINMDELLKNL